jgi:hypothetical protein
MAVGGKSEKCHFLSEMILAVFDIYSPVWEVGDVLLVFK